MTAPCSSRREKLLLYEPRNEGHHLGWLRFITEDLLSAGFPLSLAVDLRAEGRPKVEDHLAELKNEVRLFSAYNESGRRHGDRKAGSVAHCLRESGAAAVFLCAFDEIASSCWRRAALGWLPPQELRGRVGGIYHRARFRLAAWWYPGRWLKEVGFRRLLTGGWLRQLLITDPYLARELEAEFPAAPVDYLPDPCPPGYGGDPIAARRELGVPAERRVFLFYGTGSRRKGLHLAVRAMLDLPEASPAFLLCVGRQDPENAVARGLEELVQRGRARLINRYVSMAEERLSFVAADVVVLPYLRHFGGSGVLSRAMAAGKMVIVSDEQLLGRLTRDHGLGLLFPSGDAVALRDRMNQAARFSDGQIAVFTAGARRYAQQYSRAVFREALLKSLGVETQKLGTGSL